jgi:hypothetical protein
MARIFVIDLARELGVRAAELMALAEQVNIHIARMATSLPESQANRIRRYVEGIDIHRGSEGTTIVRAKDWSERMARAQERIRTEDRFGKLQHSIGEHMRPLPNEADGGAGDGPLPTR